MESEETLKNEPTLKDVADMMANRFDAIEKRLEGYDAQFEAIREGIAHGASRFDRLEGNLLLLRADLRDLTEEIKHKQKVLV